MTYSMLGSLSWGVPSSVAFGVAAGVGVVIARPVAAGQRRPWIRLLPAVRQAFVIAVLFVPGAFATLHQIGTALFMGVVGFVGATPSEPPPPPPVVPPTSTSWNYRVSG
jgi:hypothetical protein